MRRNSFCRKLKREVYQILTYKDIRPSKIGFLEESLIETFCDGEKECNEMLCEARCNGNKTGINFSDEFIFVIR